MIRCHALPLSTAGLIVQVRRSLSDAPGGVKGREPLLDPCHGHRYTDCPLNDQPLDAARRAALLDRLDGLYPAVVADCLDKVGVRSNVMHPRIRPLYRDAHHLTTFGAYQLAPLLAQVF